MTRPNKHAARFGARYAYRGTPLAALPAGFNVERGIVTLRQMGEIFRRIGLEIRDGTLALGYSDDDNRLILIARTEEPRRAKGTLMVTAGRD